MWAKEIDNLYSEMLEQLEKINGSMHDSVGKLSVSLSLIRQTMISLREFIKVNSFIDEEQEIKFFKYVKPRFAAWQTYYIELHNIISSTPIGTDQMIKDYYINEIAITDRFFKMSIQKIEYIFFVETELSFRPAQR